MLLTEANSDRPIPELPATKGGRTQRPLLLLSANSAWNILNFRMELVEALEDAGYEIAVAAPEGQEARALQRRGVRFLPLEMSAGGTSPLQDAALLARYVQLLKAIRPAAFLGFTPKPNVYGSLAARFCRVPAIANVTGLGTAFIHGSKLERLVSLLYRLSLKRSEAVFFHNPDDRDLFVERRLVDPGRASIIPGSGVDLGKFAPIPLPGGTEDPAFLFVGRLLWEKGAGEFAEAAAAIKALYPRAQFRMIGALADGERAVPRATLDSWVADGSVDYLGTCEDIRPHIAAADCIVLPSYREGLPRAILEGAAMGRPAIAADVPGCRHAIVDGETGFLCEARSGAALTRAIARMIALSPDERSAMGVRARVHAEEHLGVERVCQRYLTVLSRITANA